MAPGRKSPVELCRFLCASLPGLNPSTIGCDAVQSLRINKEARLTLANYPNSSTSTNSLERYQDRGKGDYA